MTALSALLLDFGGVLIRDDPELYARLAQEHGLSASHFYSVVEEPPHRPLLTVGTIRIDEFSGRVAAELAPDSPARGRALLAEW